MNSMDHERLVELLRKRPALLALFLERVGVLPPGAGLSVRIVAADLSDTFPAALHADVVSLLGEPAPVLAAVGEVQLGIDPAQRFSWPAYPVLVYRRHMVRCALLVITPFAEVARWAREPNDVGPGIRFAPLVIGPEEIPVVTDPGQPLELVTLSALAHGQDAPEVAIPVVRAFLSALEGAPDAAERPRCTISWSRRCRRPPGRRSSG